jgi:hypothetical protein
MIDFWVWHPTLATRVRDILCGAVTCYNQGAFDQPRSLFVVAASVGFAREIVFQLDSLCPAPCAMLPGEI